MRTWRSIAEGLVALTAVISIGGCGGGGSSEGTQTHSISGSITGQVKSGVTVSLSGGSTATTTSDANGNFVFSGLANGTYSLTPTLGRKSFSPRTLSVTLGGTNVVNQNFAMVTTVLASGVQFMPASFNGSDQLRIPLVPNGGSFFFTDSSDAPLKKLTPGNPDPVQYASKIGAPENVVIRGQNAFWIDGARLNRTSLDGASTTLLEAGRRNPLVATPDMVVDDSFVYWVNTTSGPTCDPCAWIIRQVPIAGGSASTLAAATRPIVALAVDANNIYWEESKREPISPGCQCGSSIKRIAKAGGAATVIVDNLLNGPPGSLPSGPGADNWVPTGGIAVTGARVVFAVASGPSYQVMSVANSGGAVSTLATVSIGGPFAEEGLQSVVADGSNAYWIDTRNATVSTVPLAGGTAATLASSLVSPGRLTVTSSSAIWTEKGPVSGCCLQEAAGSIRSVSLAGGPATAVVNGLDAPRSLAVDTLGNLVWTEQWRVGKVSAGLATTLASGLSTALARIATDAANVYVLDGGYIKKVPLQGGKVEKVSSAHGGAIDDPAQKSQDIATDGVNVYWTVTPSPGGFAPIVRSAPVAGGLATTLAADSAFGSPQDCNWRIAVDSQNVYWSSISSSAPVNCTIKKVPIAGGPFATLVDLASLRDFAVDGTNVYFSEVGTNPGSIRRIGIGGGAISSVTTNVKAWVIAQDALNLYWIDPSTTLGGIFSIPKAGGPAGSATQIALGPLATSATLVAEALTIDSGTVYWTESGDRIIVSQPIP